MAQWRSLLLLPPELKARVSRLYERRFPIEVRRRLRHWIEEQDWELASADELKARMLFQTILLKLDELIKESLYNNHTLTEPDFSLLKDHLLAHFEGRPLDMAVKLSECLQEEKLILDSSVQVQQNSPRTTERTHTDLENKVSKLESQIQKSEEEIKAFEKEESICKTWESAVQEMNGLANSEMQKQCFNQANSIKSKKMEVISQIGNLANSAAEIVQSLVSVQLPEWKRGQQMSCIGNPIRTSLEHLENWFSRVAESLLQIVQQLKKLQEQSRPQISPVSNLPEVTQQIHTFTCSLLTELLQNALVVEKQPVMHNQPHRPLILRTNVLFSVKLRLLANLPNLQYGCLIRAEFDKDVEEIKTIQGFRQFEFTTNNTKVMDKQNGGLVAEWDMSIKEIKAKRKRSNESPIRVTEELHVIKFSAHLQFAGLDCQVETTSLPLVVVSTTSQGPSAWASVLWYNLCPPQHASLSLFLEPPALSWQLLSQALSWQFISAGDKELDQDQLQELKLKLRIVENPGELVSWSNFSDQKEGPWLWIDGILDLIEKHMKTLWRDGCIMGFVSKDKAEALLQDKQSGNFLLRFSESNREGAITFSWVEHTSKRVRAIDPITKDELSKMSLSSHINRFSVKNRTDNPLLYLYPDIPKDQAFGRHHSNANDITNKQPVAPYLIKIYNCQGVCPTPPSALPPSAPPPSAPPPSAPPPSAPPPSAPPPSSPPPSAPPPSSPPPSAPPPSAPPPSAPPSSSPWMALDLDLMDIPTPLMLSPNSADELMNVYIYTENINMENDTTVDFM